MLKLLKNSLFGLYSKATFKSTLEEYLLGFFILVVFVCFGLYFQRENRFGKTCSNVNLWGLIGYILTSFNDILRMNLTLAVVYLTVLVPS